MSVLPRYRAIARPALGAVLVLLLVAVALGGVRVPSDVAPAALLPAYVSDPCPYPSENHTYSGTIVEQDGGAIPPVTLAYTYDAALSNGSNPSTPPVCASENGTAVANDSGTLAFAIDPQPTQRCITLPSGYYQCTVSTGPYGPVNLTLASPTPPGYLSSLTQNGTSFRLLFYPELSSVGLDPAGPSATYSAQGVEGVVAEPRTGLGAPSPVPPEFNWTLSGVGWTFTSPASGVEVNVTAAPGAGVGNLTVDAHLDAGDGGLVAPPASLELVAVSTAIAAASVNRTAVDAGQPLGVTLSGSGATGYAYRATVDPGLGAAPTPASCRSAPGIAGVVALSCSANVTYPTAGEAQPVVTLTNGNSSATWSFPEVTVDPLPSVDVSPSPPVGYVNATIDVSLEVLAGSGTGPYVEGCLGTEGTPVRCESTPGPQWTFRAVYADPGSYSARAWAIDADGGNASTETTVRVVEPLEVGLATVPADGTAGTPMVLAAVVSGGDLPARVWWNATGTATPFATGWITADGTLDATYVPSGAGYPTVSVAVVDHLGTEGDASAGLAVSAGPAAALVPSVLPSTEVVRAGTPFALGWEALDAVGELVRGYSSSSEIELAVPGSDGTAPGEINASEVGPLASRLPGWFDVPAAAWIDGTLNVTVTTPFAGAIDVVLTVAAGIPSAGGSTGVVVLPDLDHLRLFDPRTGGAAERSNDTLWQVTDRFGNAAVGASIVVTSRFGGTTTRTVLPTVGEAGGDTAVWVNVSAPANVGGTITVTDLAGDVLLPPIDVAGPPGLLESIVPLLPLLLSAGVGAA
ncbi:MAG: hypothetical protein WBE40_05310, partial [Thermoplasmata archaeon]